ncbi:YebC/PmpR family DNA-binding transcriptional regulator [Planctomycetales bacterium ZRK34]|nr:YebC/PmpR family DNA-binding transcriptional regulator [Planctomycetales bacterium ZRK34]
MAGHSKWANIKHRKARQDSKRSKMWSKCARAIIVAARNGGGDPATNLTLRYSIDEAKAANMPKDTIEKAIAKGSGELGTEAYETVIYEGYGPSGVAILVECLTDNRNRTAGEVRSAFDKSGGNLGTSGSVAYIFTAKGIITLEKSAADEEQLMEIALEAGAEDIADQDDYWEVTSEPGNYIPVKEALEAAGLTLESSEMTMIASNTVECAGDVARKVMNLVDKLEDLDDVQKVHANFDIPDEELAAME